jgi:hypothetical protein
MNSIESFKQKGNLKGNRCVRGGDKKKTDGTDLEEKRVADDWVEENEDSRRKLRHLS